MKKICALCSVFLIVTFLQISALAQTGNVKDQKNKAGNIDPTGKNSTDLQETAMLDIRNEKIVSSFPLPITLEPGKGLFYTSFKPNGFKEEVGIGDELFVRMNLGKTMIEHADANGFESSHTAYGFLSVYIDGKHVFTHGPMSFASNYSKKWQYIDIPLKVNPDFVEKISKDQSLLETPQDIWVFQQLFQDNSIPKKYAESAMKMMNSSSHEVKVEFGLGESSSNEPKIVISSGTVKVKVDEAGVKELARSGPKHLRPLDDSEKGKISYNSTTIVPQGNDVIITIDLPNAPKYYNEKWCQASSCDYDHGSMLIYVELDGQYLTHLSVELWKELYEKQKKFDLIIVPKNDASFGNMSANFNTLPILGNVENRIVYALYDKFYGAAFKSGEHSLTIKLISPETIKMNTAFEATTGFFAPLPAIAANTIKFNISDAERNTLRNSSSSNKLKHAGGEWTAIESYLIKATQTFGDATINDVACNTQWKVTKNSLGAILYRTCKADVIYTTKNGEVRTIKVVEVKQDYAGGKYSNPYFNDNMTTYFQSTSGFLNNIHYPVSPTKAK